MHILLLRALNRLYPKASPFLCRPTLGACVACCVTSNLALLVLGRQPTMRIGKTCLAATITVIRLASRANGGAAGGTGMHAAVAATLHPTLSWDQDSVHHCFQCCQLPYKAVSIRLGAFVQRLLRGCELSGPTEGWDTGGRAGLVLLFLFLSSCQFVGYLKPV